MSEMFQKEMDRLLEHLFPVYKKTWALREIVAGYENSNCQMKVRDGLKPFVVIWRSISIMIIVSLLKR
ncbi:hypothetical protein M3212_20005 [Alkalihalobacillus oceani]|uniref:hypothetical protein n=1 Tax=Halalkalibacter oceani TaxID=1653776 RepID=UPI00203CF8DD|nr:hypothetical protein [Halalkalibacter oceani]MCM3763014.1 hypothetical protein [Halalkalibacter oceani]